MERFAWAGKPILAFLLLLWADPRPSGAQSPPTPLDAQPALSAPTPGTNSTPSSEVSESQTRGTTPPSSTALPLPLSSPATAPAPRLAQAPAGRAPETSSPNPLATGLSVKSAPLEEGDLRFPINLATALRLSDARPLVVAMAQAEVWVAEAELTRAKVLWIPTLNIGFDYIRHDGGGPDINKGIMTAPSFNFFYGGAGMSGNLSGTDILFQPLVARQNLNARHWQIQTAKNNALLDTANAYFRVHQARGQYAGALYSIERGRDLVQRITNLSKEFVPKVEIERVQGDRKSVV